MKMHVTRMRSTSKETCLAYGRECNDDEEQEEEEEEEGRRERIIETEMETLISATLAVGRKKDTTDHSRRERRMRLQRLTLVTLMVSLFLLGSLGSMTTTRWQWTRRQSVPVVSSPHMDNGLEVSTADKPSMVDIPAPMPESTTVVAEAKAKPKARHWLPEQVLEQYKAQHSVDVLRSEAVTQDPALGTERKFIVGHYYCPDRAGNFLHDFADALLMAMLSNRTLVWKFADDQNYSPATNRKADCDKIMEMASWIPAWDEWRARYRLPEPLIITSRKYVKQYSGEGRFVPRDHSVVYSNHPVLRPHLIHHLSDPTEIWLGDVLLEQERAYTFASQLFGFENSSSYAKNMVPSLYEKGNAFLYGMLLRHSVVFKQDLINSIQPYVIEDRSPQKHQIIGIHSRHVGATNDGSHVDKEMTCLDGILEFHSRQIQHPWSESVRHCTLLVMSDRSATLDAIKVQGTQRNCSVVFLDHQEETSGANKYDMEHGPFAGAGFFRDWMMVAQAQAGFIHFHERSSSALVYESSTYDNIVDGIIDSPVPRCSIPKRGEPTFFNM
uniref:Uncharacterized protein n=1 Tax=Amphora coffeiformis TaxID=265554 RepID=A0A7S3P6Z7_9STRA